ncbi:MAG: F0F1 ATP synthase subunit delta [Devosia sp.]
MADQVSILAQIARPYAAALFDLAAADGRIDAVEAELSALDRLAAESADFARYLASPVIKVEEKSAALEPILSAAGAGPLVGNLLRVVARNGRLFALPAIVSAYRSLAAEARGETTAEVTSAAPLNAEQRAALAETLKARIGKSVSLNEHVDPSLIGGLVVKVGSRMIDSSLKTKLSQMKIAMKEVG